MRVTGGELRGRRLKMPGSGAVRPTQDAVREALFSMLGTRTPGSVFVDLYAGSGSVGVEAWSRGAEAVIWVEQNRRVGRVLRDNVVALCGDTSAQVLIDDVRRWVRRPTVARVDLVFADPPYDASADGDDLSGVMAELARSGCLADEALFIAEQRTGTPPPTARGWERIRDRRYGHTRLCLYRFRGAAAATPRAGDVQPPQPSHAAQDVAEGDPPCTTPEPSSTPAPSIR